MMLAIVHTNPLNLPPMGVEFKTVLRLNGTLARIYICERYVMLDRFLFH